MENLHRRFGRLLAAHRRRLGLSQQELADRARISAEMVSKMETGVTGARFPTIEKLAAALNVDSSEFFSVEFAGRQPVKGALLDIATRLSGLSENDLQWVKGVIDAALKPRS